MHYQVPGIEYYSAINCTINDTSKRSTSISISSILEVVLDYTTYQVYSTNRNINTVVLIVQ